jgi:predicted nucleic acid-binding protein
VISYFDTSAVIPLIIGEASTDRCNRIWNESSRIMCARLLYPEARAALARAHRVGRLDESQLRSAVAELDSIVTEIDHIEVTVTITQAAGDMAETHGLRGSEAVHLAAAATVADGDLVLVTGDADLAAAGEATGLAVVRTSA